MISRRIESGDRQPGGPVIGADTLNSLYFGIGVTIILALLAALVGPLLIDWTAYRAQFEERATEILGHPVQVTGTADASLLPYPELVFTGVVIGADPANPVMTVGRFDVEVELFPLLSGEVRVTRMQLERPEVTVRVDRDGSFEWIAAGSGVPVDPQKVVFDRIDVRDGSLRVVDARRPTPIAITGINAAVEARSLVGPYKFDGGLVLDGEPMLMRLSTGARDAEGRTVVKASMTPASTPVEISFDGAVSVTDRHPEWVGRARVQRIIASGDLAVPWMLEAELDADPSRIRARQLEFRYGPEDRPFSISGAATVDLTAEPTFDAVLSARQIDLDRTLGEGPDNPVAFEDALAALATTLGTLPPPPIEGRIGFDIPGLVVGGSLVQSLRLDVTTAPSGWTVETLEAGLPGRSRVTATGDLVTRPSLAFEGTVGLASEQPATLVSWWYPTRERTNLDPFDARARVSASVAGLTLADVVTVIDGSSVTGDVAYVPQRSDRNARLDLSLGAGSIALDQVAAVARLFTADEQSPQATDVVVRLAADEVTGGDTAAEGVDVSASLVDGTLDVERFFVRDLAGARISAQGSVRDVATTPDGSMQARVAAERLDGVAALVEALAPGSAAAAMLRNAAPALVPATLDATVTAARVGEGTNASITVRGSAGGSTVDSTFAFAGRVDRWSQASVDLAVDVAGPDGVRLMRQLGFAVPDIGGGAGAGRLEATLHGVPEEGLSLALTGALGGTTVQLGGETVLASGRAPTAFLDVDLVSDDVSPILTLGGDLVADLLGRSAVDLSARAELDGPKLALSSLNGTVDGERIAGELFVDLAPATPAVRGALTMRSATLEGMLELALGQGTMMMPIIASNNPWPEAPFGPTALDGIDADVSVTIDRVTVEALGLSLDGFSTDVRSSAAGIGFDAIEAEVAGGKIGGSLVVKRDLEGQAAISGTFALRDAAADALVWRRNDRPVATGQLGLDLEFNATGRTVAGLVSTLTGGGTLRVADGVIHSMNPRAFNAVIRAADAGQELPDERIRALFADNVDVGDLSFERIEGSFTIASGVVRAPSLSAVGAAATTTASATLDLPHLSLESDWKLSLSRADAPDAATAPPQVDILFRGRLAEPERRIDVTAFSSYLGIRAFERETERVLVMQADILERELLSRAVLRTREEAERRIRAEEEARRRAEDEAEAERVRAEAAARDPFFDDLTDAPPIDAPTGGEPLIDEPLSDEMDAIGRQIQGWSPDAPVDPPIPPPTPTVTRPQGSTPPPTVQRIPLPPLGETGDASLPGVRIAPPAF